MGPSQVDHGPLEEGRLWLVYTMAVAEVVLSFHQRLGRSRCCCQSHLEMLSPTRGEESLEGGNHSPLNRSCSFLASDTMGLELVEEGWSIAHCCEHWGSMGAILRGRCRRHRPPDSQRPPGLRRLSPGCVARAGLQLEHNGSTYNDTEVQKSRRKQMNEGISRKQENGAVDVYDSLVKASPLVAVLGFAHVCIAPVYSNQPIRSLSEASIGRDRLGYISQAIHGHGTIT
jgi:hypothetical protein